MTSGNGVLIRDCGADDLDRLEQSLPTGGTTAHAAHFARQRDGTVTYLTAWQQAEPVGSAVLDWTGDRDPDSRAALSGCPVISNLGVAPAKRGQGIGTQLVAAAEKQL